MAISFVKWHNTIVKPSAKDNKQISKPQTVDKFRRTSAQQLKAHTTKYNQTFLQGFCFIHFFIMVFFVLLKLIGKERLQAAHKRT